MADKIFVESFYNQDLQSVMSTSSTEVNVDVAPAQDYGYAVLENGESNQEIIKWQAKAGLTISSMLRGLSLTALTDTEVAGNKKTHLVNDTIQETNVHYLINDKVSNAGYETIAGKKIFTLAPKCDVEAGATVPTACTAGSPSAGGSVDLGTHSYKISYVDDLGGETIAGTKSNVITTAGSNKTVALTAIPTGDDDTVSRKIYRTVAGDTGDWKLLATIADATTTVYSDIIADGSLGASALTVPVSYEFVRHSEYIAEVVKLTGAQTIAGVKTLTSIPVLPASDPTTANQATRKSYVDALVAALSIPNIVDEHVIYTPGYLTGGSSAETTVALWDNLADASFRATIDGTAYNVDGMDMTATGPLGIVTDMDDVASVLQHYIRIETSALETVTWSTDHFIFTSADTTSTSAILVLETSTGTVGTDISGAGADDWTDSDTGNGTATAGVLDPTADSGKLVKLNSAGNFGIGIPAGVIYSYIGSSAPAGYLLCDGSEVSRTTYSGLFTAISDRFGGGDGSTTFNVPNMENRIPIGVDTSVKTVIDACETNWTAGADVTSATDATDYKTGSKSIKLTVDGGAGAGQILGYYTVSVANLYAQTTIGVWLKSSIALSAGDLQYMIDDTAAIASPSETIDIPALQAGVWTKVYLPLANPQDDLSLISHGIYQVNDKGAFTLNIDDVAYGENYEIGAEGGAKTHKLAGEQSGVPAHTHPVPLYNGGGAGGGKVYGATSTLSSTGVTSASTLADATQSHSLLQPYLTVNYIIKT